MIRRAVVADVPALARVQVRAWLHAYSGFMEPDEIAARPVEAREPQWRTALTDPANPGTTVVWDQDGAVAGFATTGPARDEDLAPGTGELYAMYVDPPARRGGAAGGQRLRPSDAVDVRRQRPRDRVLRAPRLAARSRGAPTSGPLGRQPRRS